MSMPGTIALLCSIALVAEPPPPDPGEGPDAEAAPEEDVFTRARRLHEAGRYDEAAVAYAEAWVSQPAPDILYDWAQVERLSGHCEQAVELYDRFLAMDDGGRPSEQYADLYYPEDWSRMVGRATEMRERCRVELEDEAASQTEAETPEQEPPPEPTVVAPDEPAVEPGPSIEDEPPPRSWRRDPAGIALVSTGASLLGAGIGLMVAAEVHDATARDQPSHDEFLQRIDTAATEQLVGIVALGVGGAVAVGGVIRFAVVARRSGSSRRARVTAWGGRSGAGVGVVGRF